MKRILITAFIGVLLALFLVSDSAIATMIMKKSFTQIALDSELIFEGKILSKETRILPLNNKPFTYFTFEIIDVVKGNYSEGTIELGFLGGSMGDLVLEVSDMKMPEVGERGFYFVKTLDELYVHPLTGWHQGHYLVIEGEQGKIEVVVPVLEQETQTSLNLVVPSQTVEDFRLKIHKAIEGEQ